MTLFQPEHFRSRDERQVLDLIAANPFATLISPGADPLVTHLPLRVESAAADWIVIGHVARANPHWRALEAAPEALAIIHGPSAYVSPNWYTVREAVPTWNYMVVHLKLQVTTVHDAGAKDELLKELIATFEPGYAAQWREFDQEFRDRMLGGIVGLRARVLHWDAKFKLSQNRPEADRPRVVDALAAGDARAQDVARWMRQLRIGS